MPPRPSTPAKRTRCCDGWARPVRRGGARGYRWRPWPSDTALADSDLILDYVRTVAEEYDVDKLIRYRIA